MASKNILQGLRQDSGLTSSSTQPLPFRLMYSPKFCSFIVTASTILWLPVAMGQAPQPQEPSVALLEEIIVTAQKREQRVQDVPLSLDVLSSTKLDTLRSSAQDILFLSASSPSLYAESSSGRTFPRFYIRGLGNTDFDLNANQPVSLIYDEVVLENPILKGFPVFDLDRIEILRGPQGTLFGRNTPAGAIKFESAKPTEHTEGYGRISYGRFDTVDVEGALSGALSDTVTARVSGLYQQRDDFVDNTFNGGEDGFEEFDEFAGRLLLNYAPNDNVNVLLNLHSRSLNGGSRVFRANIIEPGIGGLTEDFKLFETAQDATQRLNVDNHGASIKTDIELSAGTLSFISSYESVEVQARGDVDGGFGASFAPPSGPGFIPFSAESADNINDHSQLTQEIRYVFDPLDSLTTTIGGFAFFEDLEIENLSFDTLDGGRINGLANQEQETTAYALFASTEWRLNSKLSINGGLRWSDEHKEFVASRSVGPFGSGALAPIRRDLDDAVLSGDLSLSYKVNEQSLAYARYARSFRAPNVQGRIVFGDSVTVAETETIDSFEVGLKSELLDGKAYLNLSSFYFATDDQQLTAVGGAGNFNQLLNADSVEGYGFEIDSGINVGTQTVITAGVSLNNTEINDDTLEVGTCGAPCLVRDPINPVTGNALINGNPLPQAPKYIANLTAHYSWPLAQGEIYLYADIAYRSEINFFLYESAEFRSRGLTETGLRAAYKSADSGYEFAIFGRNIFDQRSIEGAIDFNNFSGFVNDPAIWGIELLKQF
ncbi:TonB-dependent receptor [Arenicella xantha]|uniref:Iron complex outermembrane receptor protein n=1 Tax=Arenicella xantha TaxID=644221 RepID=A0A395JSV1_9GAMM|nr:TonB-dependent receptor [Arenicella xantha]RBP53546.1 iron complex outermembrane receptor protein [Arenicella xantha]